MENGHTIIKCILIALMLLIGLFGNLFNTKIFSSERMKKITTFKYLFYLSFIDMILLSVWCAFKFIILIHYQTCIYEFYKVIIFVCNYLSQMSNWIFMISNINKARLMIKELRNQKQNKTTARKKDTPKISIHLKIIILIGIFLFILNSHYLIYFNVNKLFGESKLDSFKMMNLTQYFIYKDLKKASMNYSEDQIEYIIDKFISNNEFAIKDGMIVQYFINPKYKYFLNNTWVWMYHFLFCFIPFTANLVSILIIIKTNRNLINPKRIRFNNQLISLFIIANLVIITNTIVYYICIISFNKKEYELDLYHIHVFAQIILYLKHTLKFIIYLITLRGYRKGFLKLFHKKNKK